MNITKNCIMPCLVRDIGIYHRYIFCAVLIIILYLTFYFGFSVLVQSRLFPWEIYPGSVSPCLWGGYRHGAQTMYWKWGSVCHLSLLLWRHPGHPFYHISQESTFQKCWNWVQGWNSILNPIAKFYSCTSNFTGMRDWSDF